MPSCLSQDRADDAAPGHRLREDDLLDAMEQTFSPAEARRKLDTVIRWGRYAGLFSYDDDRGEFHAVAQGEA